MVGTHRVYAWIGRRPALGIPKVTSIVKRTIGGSSFFTEISLTSAVYCNIELKGARS